MQHKIMPNHEFNSLNSVIMGSLFINALLSMTLAQRKTIFTMIKERIFGQYQAFIVLKIETRTRLNKSELADEAKELYKLLKQEKKALEEVTQYIRAQEISCAPLSPWEIPPGFLLQSIYSFLSLKELGLLMKVNRFWNHVPRSISFPVIYAESERVFREALERHAFLFNAQSLILESISIAEEEGYRKLFNMIYRFSMLTCLRLFFC